MRKWQKASGTKEQREHERKRVFIRATMATAAGVERAFVRNLSCGGALLDCNAAVRTGDSVQLRCEELLADATIAWTHNKQIGLQFAEALPDERIATFLSARPPRSHGARRAAKTRSGRPSSIIEPVAAE